MYGFFCSNPTNFGVTATIAKIDLIFLSDFSAFSIPSSSVFTLNAFSIFFGVSLAYTSNDALNPFASFV